MMYDFFIAPLVDIVENPLFFIEVVIGGMSTGIMYALVAMGFAIIFKASGIVNFAQGAMVLFAALTFVGQLEMGVPVWLALLTRSPSWWCWPGPSSASCWGRWSTSR
jgi:branched-chain amino acid transport system permease protein